MVSVTSLGEPAEVRTDTITPSLFTLEGDDAVDGDTDTTDVATDEGAP